MVATSLPVRPVHLARSSNVNLVKLILGSHSYVDDNGRVIQLKMIISTQCPKDFYPKYAWGPLIMSATIRGFWSRGSAMRVRCRREFGSRGSIARRATGRRVMCQRDSLLTSSPVTLSQPQYLRVTWILTLQIPLGECADPRDVQHVKIDLLAPLCCAERHMAMGMCSWHSLWVGRQGLNCQGACE